MFAAYFPTPVFYPYRCLKRRHWRLLPFSQNFKLHPRNDHTPHAFTIEMMKYLNKCNENQSEPRINQPLKIQACVHTQEGKFRKDGKIVRQVYSHLPADLQSPSERKDSRTTAQPDRRGTQETSQSPALHHDVQLNTQNTRRSSSPNI